MNYQTIDGVPRELRDLLENVLRCGLDAIVVGAELTTLRQELRALLDSPAPTACATPGCSVCPGDGVGPCKNCPDEKPRGEPVAWMRAESPGMCVSAEVKAHNSKIGGAPAKGVEMYTVPLYTEQPAPLRFGSGVTIENVGFGSEEGRKPFLVFGADGNLTEVNLVNVSLVSKCRTYTPAQLAAIGVQVATDSPAGPDKISMNRVTIFGNGGDNPIKYTMNGIIVNLDDYVLIAPGVNYAVTIPSGGSATGSEKLDGTTVTPDPTK